MMAPKPAKAARPITWLHPLIQNEGVAIKMAAKTKTEDLETVLYDEDVEKAIKEVRLYHFNVV